jgi:hypothetical protein
VRLARRLLPLLAGPLLAAAGTDRPPALPTRDVDVVYMMVRPDAPGGPVVLEQRMRWAAAPGLLRIDPPTPGLWVVMDTAAHRLSTVREAERSVLELTASEAHLGPEQGMPGAPAAGFVRQGTGVVSGLACTEWETHDISGVPTQVCITADGVLLRARAGTRVLIEALHVAFMPQDPSVFRIPPGYRRIAPPPLKH